MVRLIMPAVMVATMISCKSGKVVTEKELQSEIKYLSSQELGGRLTGSEGDSLAAEYIRSQLSSFGLKPLSGDGFQRYKVTSKLVAGNANKLIINEKSFTPGTDFTPFAFSSNSTLKNEVVFAGYGFSIDGDSLKWNDYNGLDVNGKWVLILRGDPESEKTVSAFIPFSKDRDKALLAKDKGAAGVMLVSGPVFDPQDKLESLNPNDFSVGIPVFQVKREVADLILEGKKLKITELEKKLNESRRPFSVPSGIQADGTAEVTRELNTTRNVAMILPGEDETLKNEYIIIGAHFDHLGMGGPGSGSRAVDTVAVHGGADDNASGVALMLEMAEKFASTPGSHKRSIVCVAFSGEEEGLLGSKYFAENPGIDLVKVNAMINLDMVGRLNETSNLQVYGVGTSTGLKDLVTSFTDTNAVKLVFSEEGYGPSDHSSFYGKNIPVLFFTTGAHLDYHTPQDTWDKVNYQGILKVEPVIFKTTENLASTSEKLTFKEAGPKTDQSRQVRMKGVTLGIMPDFAGNVKNGLRADFVTPGKPAALGGMKKGDIITSINGMAIGNIQDYMFRMGQLKHGQTINVEVLRNGEKTVLLIQL